MKIHEILEAAFKPELCNILSDPVACHDSRCNFPTPAVAIATCVDQCLPAEGKTFVTWKKTEQQMVAACHALVCNLKLSRCSLPTCIYWV